MKNYISKLVHIKDIRKGDTVIHNRKYRNAIPAQITHFPIFGKMVSCPSFYPPLCYNMSNKNTQKGYKIMNKLRIATLVAALACSGTALSAEDIKIEPFAGVEYSITKANTEYDFKNNSIIADRKHSYTATSTAVKIGATLEDAHRIYFLGNSSSSIHLTYDYMIELNKGFEVYGGIGAGYNSYKTDYVTEKGFTVKLEAGILYAIHPHVSIDAGYRRMETSSTTETADYEAKMTSGNVFFAGLLYNF